MVAGKVVRAAMGLQKSAPSPKRDAPPLKSPSPAASSGGKVQGKSVFSKSFGAYFPRSSAQVQPRPPDVAELVRLVEELRERESRLRTELLEHKLLREAASIVPALEAEIAEKCAENERLGKELEAKERKVKELESEMAELRSEMAEMRSEKAAEIEIAEARLAGLAEASGKSNLIRSLKKGARCTDIVASHEINHNHKLQGSDSNSSSKREEIEITSHTRDLIVHNLRSRVPRVPKPPPRPSPPSIAQPPIAAVPPPPPPPPSIAAVPPPAPARSLPPPPPPPPRGVRAAPAKVRRVPEVVELYHSLMRRDSKKDSAAGVGEAQASSNARDMIGEIENRSAYLLAIKTDVETQGDFIRFLIREVETASFTSIEDVVPFVKWLDDELSYLVDERAVLKHFTWPEQKADALREAAFGYSDLKKIETEASSLRDDPRQPCSSALKKMQSLLEKLEHSVYNLSRMRESAANRYKNFQIPMDWMQEAGIVSQIKLASVKLAMKYMKRVSAELETVGGGPEEEELIVQGVRFAFRVHQFAGGFDADTMRAFQELRDKARSCHEQQQPQKLLCRSSSVSAASTTPC